MPSKRLLNMRKDAESIFDRGLQAADSRAAVRRFVSLEKGMGVLRTGDVYYDLKRVRRIFLVGAGKAAAGMAEACEEILGDRITDGAVIVKYGYGKELHRVKVFEAGHPIPDGAGVKGTKAVLRILKKAEKEDLVLCLVSGGGSSLLVGPPPGITLRQKQKTTNLLLGCGATIGEINIVRKHLSLVKGGRLAQLAAPARMISLILSDVVGDRLESVASGPTVPSEDYFQQAWEILMKYRLTQKIPLSARKRLTEGMAGRIPENPSYKDPVLGSIQNLVVGNNRTAMEAASQRARELHYRPFILSSFIEGESRDVARVHAAIAREVLASGHPISSPACLISGGETTVTLHGKGKGGRNQEFVLAAALAIDGLKEVVVLSGGTDGTDGPTDAAGAIADGESVRRARKKDIEPAIYLQENDSYHFFQKTGSLLVTGPTYTNVMDLRLVLVDKEEP